MATQPLAHWWNQSWGTVVRRDVWVELLDDGRYQVRWRGGEWRDRDGTWRSTDKQKAWATVQELLVDEYDWKRI